MICQRTCISTLFYNILLYLFFNTPMSIYNGSRNTKSSHRLIVFFVIMIAILVFVYQYISPIVGFPSYNDIFFLKTNSVNENDEVSTTEEQTQQLETTYEDIPQPVPLIDVVSEPENQPSYDEMFVQLGEYNIRDPQPIYLYNQQDLSSPIIKTSIDGIGYYGWHLANDGRNQISLFPQEYIILR